MMKNLRNDKGYMAIIGSIVALVIAVVLVGNVVMPSVIGTPQARAADMTCMNAGPPVSYNASCNNAWNWTASEVALWGVLGLLVIVSLFAIIGGTK
jgi:hypothetical protein